MSDFPKTATEILANKELQRHMDHCKAMREAGLVRVEVWVQPEIRQAVLQFVEARVNMLRIAKEANASRPLTTESP